MSCQLVPPSAVRSTRAVGISPTKADDDVATATPRRAFDGSTISDTSPSTSRAIVQLAPRSREVRMALAAPTHSVSPPPANTTSVAVCGET